MVDKASVRPASSEVYRLWGENTLIRELTGFKLKYNIKQGLKETIEWFSMKKNLRKYKSEIYNI